MFERRMLKLVIFIVLAVSCGKEKTEKVEVVYVPSLPPGQADSLKEGQPGPQGEPGAKGDKGEPGAKGDKGEPCEPIEPIEPEPRVDKGKEYEELESSDFYVDRQGLRYPYCEALSEYVVTAAPRRPSVLGWGWLPGVEICKHYKVPILYSLGCSCRFRERQWN